MLGTIRAKVVTAIVLVLVVVVAASIVITVENQTSNLLEAKRTDLTSNSDIVNASIRNVMLAGEAPIAVNLLSDLAETPGFETMQLYRRDGTAAFSDHSTLREVNANQNMMTFEQTPRVEAEGIDNPVFDDVVATNTPRIVENLDEEQLEYYFPILNYSDCRVCHGSDHFVRGVAYYRVSLENIFDRIETARNTLIGFFAVVGVIIAALLIQLMQRIVIGPIRQIGEVVGMVGAGNLDVEANIRSSREFDALSEKLNSMIDGLKEKSRLEIQNSVMEARDEENRKYLDNIAEGLLLLGRDHRISQQHSKYLETLFGTSEITGKTLAEFVYPDEEQYKSEREELEQFVTMVFENTATDMEMIMSVNPLANRRLRVGETGEEIVVDTFFQRIYGDDGSVESVMVIFQDKTEVVRAEEKLESERERYKSDIEHIATLLKIGPEAFQDFDRDAVKTIDAVEASLTQRPDGDDRNALMRDLHSLKGTARYLEFSKLAELAHATEEVYSLVDKGELSWESEGKPQIESLVTQMRTELENMRQIDERFRSFVQGAGQEDADQAALQDFVEHLEKMTKEIAHEIGKDVEVQVVNRLSRLPHLTKLRNPVIHLVRNAIDHGIEDEYERITVGKQNTGRITFSFSERNGEYRLSIIDDGRGINFEEIRRRGVERGLLEENRDYSETELLRTLFRPSFSTRDRATTLSGRGVGLDVVHEEVRSLGGRITVASRAGEGTRFTLTVPKESE